MNTLQLESTVNLAATFFAISQFLAWLPSGLRRIETEIVREVPTGDATASALREALDSSCSAAKSAPGSPDVIALRLSLARLAQELDQVGAHNESS